MPNKKVTHAITARIASIGRSKCQLYHCNKYANIASPCMKGLALNETKNIMNCTTIEFYFTSNNPPYLTIISRMVISIHALIQRANNITITTDYKQNLICANIIPSLLFER